MRALAGFACLCVCGAVIVARLQPRQVADTEPPEAEWDLGEEWRPRVVPLTEGDSRVSHLREANLFGWTLTVGPTIACHKPMTTLTTIAVQTTVSSPYPLMPGQVQVWAIHPTLRTPQGDPVKVLVDISDFTTITVPSLVVLNGNVGWQSDSYACEVRLYSGDVHIETKHISIPLTPNQKRAGRVAEYRQAEEDWLRRNQMRTVAIAESWDCYIANTTIIESQAPAGTYSATCTARVTAPSGAAWTLEYHMRPENGCQLSEYKFATQTGEGDGETNPQDYQTASGEGENLPHWGSGITKFRVRIVLMDSSGNVKDEDEELVEVSNLPSAQKLVVMEDPAEHYLNSSIGGSLTRSGATSELALQAATDAVLAKREAHLAGRTAYIENTLGGTVHSVEVDPISYIQIIKLEDQGDGTWDCKVKHLWTITIWWNFAPQRTPLLVA